MTEEEEGTEPWVWILLAIGGLGVLTCCVGIAAAIAIPQFMNYVNKSKSAEAKITMQSTVSAVREHYLLNDEVPGVGMTLRSTETVPTQGEKVKVDLRRLSKKERRLWRQIDWPTGGSPMYFQYVYSATETDGDYDIELEARADFVKGGPKHTIVREIHIRDGEFLRDARHVEHQYQ